MALILIVIIMIIGLGIVGSLYSSIGPFVYKLGNITNYNIAYYGAMMSTERGLLALRYHDAGFQGSSGLSSGSKADSGFNHPFGRFTQDPTSSVYWSITSRSVGIPGTGNGNVEILFSTGDSSNYNSLGYYEGLEIPLYIDMTSNVDDYYQANTNLQPLNGGGGFYIKGNFRVPPKIQAGLSNQPLDDTTDIDSDTVKDDVIVNRGLKGIDNLNNDNFSIIPTIKQDFTLGVPLYQFDNALRESIINDGASADNINSNFGGPNNGFNISIPGNGETSILDEHNILPLTSALTGDTFDTILATPWANISGLTLSFSITNRMRTLNNNIYPFLEWKLRACDIGGCNITMADRYYTIQGVSTIGDYTVRMTIKKPVRNTSNASNFTIIF